jgi:short subunit dehydrogenase-like uncharacterized protein
MKNSVLILGSYGNFGGYISKTLLSRNIPIIISGRNETSLNTLQKKLSGQYPNKPILSQIVDIDKVTAKDLNYFSPKVVINTCGPFQTANYQIV